MTSATPGVGTGVGSGVAVGAGVGDGVGSLTALRNSPYCYIAVAPLAGWVARDQDESLCERVPLLRQVPTAVCALFFAVALMAADSCWSVLSANLGEHLEAASWAAAAQEEGDTCYTNFEAGSRAEWEGLSCYMDPRAEVFFERVNGTYDWFAEYVDLYEDPSGRWPELSRRYRFDWLVLPKDDWLLAAVRKDDDYELVFESETDGSTAWRRKDSEQGRA